MDSDGLSSPPPAMYSELPPSSAPDPTPTANATPRRQIADALTIDAAADSNEPEGTSRRRRRPRQVNGEVPMVKDAVGESVAESFESFLKM
jgi:DNA replication licensing factor MCM6